MYSVVVNIHKKGNKKKVRKPKKNIEQRKL